MATVSKIIPVILSGGGGTRLWPLSTPERPKQFLALTGDQTMFQMTVARVADQTRFAPPIIVANVTHAKMVERQLADVGMDAGALLLEPCARNTAPAIALAALTAGAADAPLLVMPSDHVIADLDAFQRAIDAAMPAVTEGWLVTFGITPTGPETGYGYIEVGEVLGDGLQRVSRFVEKPDQINAARMVADGNHVWNGGIFLFRADAYLAALAAYAPGILSAAKLALKNAQFEGAIVTPDAVSFGESPSDSIDYAVMEKSDRVAVAPVSMGWSDVGSWDALYDLSIKDADGNFCLGDVVQTQCENNMIRGAGLRISIAGAKNLIVIAHGNEVLILPRGQSQNVKALLALHDGDEKKV
jgi:mannose-1-phosphate guanylyltransferase